jgi:hypothetical protein
MISQINPEAERIRAEAMLRSFTDYEAAVDLFVPHGSQNGTAELEAAANSNNSQSPVMRVLKALKLNRRPVVNESVQQPAYAARQVTIPDCCS